MSRSENPPAASGTRAKPGTDAGAVPGHDVTKAEGRPRRGFPAGLAIAILALILVGSLAFALLFASDAPDLSPEETTVIPQDG